MKFFPDYGAKERKEETKSSFAVLLIFLVVFIASAAVFVWGGSDFPPAGDGAWDKLRWAALLVAVFAFFLVGQALLSLFVAATVGPERFFGLYVVAFAVCGAVAWLFS